MGEHISEFLNYLINQKKYSKNTSLNYEIDILDFKFFLDEENTNYKDVDYEFIKKYLMNLYDKKLSRASVARKLSSLRSFYKYLFNINIISVNPFKYVSSPKKEKKLPKYLGVVELESIFMVPDKSTIKGQRDSLILEL